MNTLSKSVNPQVRRGRQACGGAVLNPYLCAMDYFKRLKGLLAKEKEADKQAYVSLTSSASAQARRDAGMTWYPIAIRGTELGKGDYLTVEVERTTHQDITHQLRTGAEAALFSNHDAANDRIEGTISFVGGDRLKLSLRVDELPDWTRDGKLGIDLLFDDKSYEEMEGALTRAAENVRKGSGRSAGACPYGGFCALRRDRRLFWNEAARPERFAERGSAQNPGWIGNNYSPRPSRYREDDDLGAGH